MTATLTIPVLDTLRLRLRGPEARDWPAFHAFALSERSAGVGGPFGDAEAREEFDAILNHWTARGYGRWIVADRTTDEPLGVVGLLNPKGWPEPEIAYLLFAPAEGRGIAFEAARAARRYAYGTLGWRTAISLVMPDNPRSMALARRLGCTRDGDFALTGVGTLQIWRHPGPEAA